MSNWNGVTPFSRKLLAHWSAGPPTRDDPVLFCQREAAETVIFLAEVAGRYGTADYRRRLEPENRLHNDGLPRVALKVARRLALQLSYRADDLLPVGQKAIAVEGLVVAA